MFLNNQFMHDSFLYATNENFHNVFRMIIQMKEFVQEDILQKALNTAIIRYPYLSVKVIQTKEGYDVVKNDQPMIVYHGFEAPYLGTKETNEHLIAVGYEENTIFIDCYHSLTDGNGITPFAKTLLYYYLCDSLDKPLNPTGIVRLEDPMDDEEINDPTSKIKDYPSQPIYEYKPEECFHITEKDKETTHLLKIDEQSFMEHSMSKDSSPNAALAAMFYKVLLQHHDVDQPIVAGVAMTTRQALDAEKSYTNLVSLLNLKYTSDMKDFDLLKLGTLGRGMMFLQSQPENVLYGIKNRQKLVDYLASLPNDEARQKAYYEMILRMKALDTFFISYTGKKDWGAVESYIDSIYVLSPNGADCFGINVYVINHTFGIAINQNFESDRYVKSFINLLEEENVSYTYEGKIPLELSKVKVIG